MQTIMIVDDDPLLVRTVSRVLEYAGYCVVSHNSGFGLSDLVRRNRPDLLLLDVNMPGLSGDGALSTLRALADRSNALNVPVVFHSGVVASRLKHLADDLGAVGHLCKPAPNALLLDTVGAALATDAPA